MDLPDVIYTKKSGVFISKDEALQGDIKDALYRAPISDEEQKMIEEFKGKSDALRKS